uniref:MADF domain-containing protein n=1 Tax=Timema douglasi TaxID=61478 RepID=A0A7R8VLM1_TIMDO|nr:unnamed protein product [Timema douglasi]
MNVDCCSHVQVRCEDLDHIYKNQVCTGGNRKLLLSNIDVLKGVETGPYTFLVSVPYYRIYTLQELVPDLILLPTDPEKLLHLICCGCKKGCNHNCACKKSGPACSAMCHCLGEVCSNSSSPYFTVDMHSRAFLYDAKSGDYRDQEMGTNAWEEIAKELKIKLAPTRVYDVVPKPPVIRIGDTRKLVVEGLRKISEEVFDGGDLQFPMQSHIANIPESIHSDPQKSVVKSLHPPYIVSARWPNAEQA